MSKVLFSFDAHDGAGNGRDIFEAELCVRGWLDYFIISDMYHHLPETTLIIDADLTKVSQDIKDANQAAKALDPAFKLTRTALAKNISLVAKDMKARKATPSEITKFKANFG